MNPFANLSHENRKMLVTFVGAGVAALFAEHWLKPQLKGKLRV